MISSISANAFSALMLVLAAGAAMPALGRGSDAAQEHTALGAHGADYCSSRSIKGHAVSNDNGEHIADVSDLILERGSGRAQYVIIKTGSKFGMGGRAIAIPYGSFRWEDGETDRLILSSTPEQLKLHPEYTSQGWRDLDDPAKSATSALRQRLHEDASSPSDPYSGGLDTAARERVEGEITNVERITTTTFGEQIVISVRTSEGATKKVALGPSWYVNASTAAPMRGQQVVVETYPLTRDPEKLLSGTRLTSNGRELLLRETDGTAVWSRPTVVTDGRTYSTPYSRYLIMSEVQGMKVDCRGSECGKVHEVILDRTTGNARFLSIDPNQNFLGIGDAKRLIPWSVATVALDGTMRIDASKEMVLANPETPSDIALLNGAVESERVYKAYDVAVPSSLSPSAGAVADHAPYADAWSVRGPILSAIVPGSDRRFEGKVMDVTEVTFKNGIPSARALKLRPGANAGDDEVILVGPAWYMQHQTSAYGTGDTVVMECCKTMVEGHSYWLARSITCKDSRVSLLDERNNPAWPQR